MLKSAKHEIFPAQKCKNANNLLFMGILTFMSRKNSILSLSEPEKKLNFLMFSDLWAFNFL